jgi:hypothetical protein
MGSIDKNLTSIMLGLGTSVGKRKTAVASPPAPAPAEEIPEPPTTEERASAITDAAQKAKLKRRTIKGRQATILTDPLGLEGSGNIQQKTLLGE